MIDVCIAHCEGHRAVAMVQVEKDIYASKMSDIERRTCNSLSCTLASYRRSTDIWKDINCIMYFANCGALDIIRNINQCDRRYNFKHHMEIVRQTLLGSLGNPNSSTCLAYACKMLKKITSDAEELAVMWIKTDDHVMFTYCFSQLTHMVQLVGEEPSFLACIQLSRPYDHAADRVTQHMPGYSMARHNNYADMFVR